LAAAAAAAAADGGGGVRSPGILELKKIEIVVQIMTFHP